MSFIISQLFIRPSLPPLDLTGKTVLVTGSNGGLGLEAARHFVNLSASRVILTSRDPSAGQKAVRSIHESTRTTNTVECWPLDLSSYDSVRAFAKRALEDLERLDIVVQNAAVGTGIYRLDESHEASLTVNVVSTFYLGMLLLPKMKDTFSKFPTGGKPSMTFVVSSIHWMYFPTDINRALAQDETDVFDFLSRKENFSGMTRYNDTKLLEVALVREFAGITGPESPVVVNMTNPALCHSRLTREAGWWIELGKLLVARSTSVGARTLVAGAAVGEGSHGKYLEDGRVCESGVSGWLTGPKGSARQKRIWKDLRTVLEKIQPGVMELM